MTARVKRWTGGGKAGLHFHCPGCNEAHTVTTEPTGWGFNGDLERPTFTPSILIRCGHYASTFKSGDKCWCNYEERLGEKPPFHCFVCHSFVTDGKIQFLGDCTHELAGQTVDLPAWEDQA